jgi:hypothetical protein
MNKKTTYASNRLSASTLGNHSERAVIEPGHVFFNSPSVLSFLSWIDPPIGVTMRGIDNAHPNYKVRMMVVRSTSGSLSILPFAEPFAWNPMAAPSIRVQYQLSSTLPNDPAGREYYETMVLSQSAPGSQTIRTRVFVPPQTTPFGSPVQTGSATGAVPATMQVNGVIDSTNLVRTVYYQHFTVSDALGPPDLFLQQPW